MPNKKTKADKGFTLVELLIVISIIAILSVIGMVIYSSVQKNARDSRRRADLKAIANALEIYHQNNGAYPNSNWVCSSSTATVNGGVCLSNGTNWIPGLSSYFSGGVVPADPINSGSFADAGKYGYAFYSTAYGGPGKWFMLVAPLENPTAADIATQCTAPDNSVFHYGADGKSFMVCNSQ